jgi:hypothetical protein
VTVSAKGGLQTVGKGLPISTAWETGKYKLNNLNFGECITEQSLHKNGQKYGLRWLEMNRSPYSSSRYRLSGKISFWKLWKFPEESHRTSVCNIKKRETGKEFCFLSTCHCQIPGKFMCGSSSWASSIQQEVSAYYFVCLCVCVCQYESCLILLSKHASNCCTEDKTTRKAMQWEWPACRFVQAINNIAQWNVLFRYVESTFV